MVRLAFFGSPAFALPSLNALVAAGQRPLLVVTQPTRRAGRGLELQSTAVHARALRLGLPVEAPARLNGEADFRERLGRLGLDVAVVVAYGSRLPSELLTVPRRGFLNLHPSLLPRYRGATPIPAALRAGDPETGLTLMVLDQGLDTGPIVAQARVSIPPDATTPSFSATLATVGARLLVEHLVPYVLGQRTAHPQDASAATVTKPLRREDGRLNWRESAVALDRQIRAYQPWPGAWTTWQGQPLKILTARVRNESGFPGLTFLDPPLRVGCGKGSLELLTVQFPSGRPMSSSAALAGRPLLGQELF